MVVPGVPLALTRLAADADPNLVMPIGGGAGRDEPLTAALVAGEDLVAVELEEAQAAKDVGRFWFGSGLVRWLR